VIFVGKHHNNVGQKRFNQVGHFSEHTDRTEGSLKTNAPDALFDRLNGQLTFLRTYALFDFNRRST
jgi:hypothetical protein